MTLTGRGWALGVITVALVVAGVLFGIEELFAVAAATLILIISCALWVWRRPWSLRSARQVTPSRVPAGAHAGVELGIRNISDRRSPVVAVRYSFGGRLHGSFALAPMHPGETARASHRLPTTERGVFTIGPLLLEIADPFGLVSATRRGAESSILTVYPRIVSLQPPRRSLGADPHAPDAMSVIVHHGSDFYAVREYRTGDDLRRVHWPSTARLDELMVRQEETPSQGRLSVAVDLRPATWAGGGLETALSAAASVADAALADGLVVRLITTAGVSTRFASGSAQRVIILDALADVDLGASDLGTGALARLVDARSGEAVVVVTSSSETGRSLVSGFVRTQRHLL
ncbi:MAG: DUF58 domain-containing protein, partial [Actinomycetota bacterium]|nr:DUF58 domain-containing protein [Actinomycetota bacterium]